jgi:hypothetical protein
LDVHGEPYVTDYGLAKRVLGDSELTASGGILGTLPYLAHGAGASLRPPDLGIGAG